MLFLSRGQDLVKGVFDVDFKIQGQVYTFHKKCADFGVDASSETGGSSLRQGYGTASASRQTPYFVLGGIKRK
jgi:hypothetical protein